MNVPCMWGFKHHHPKRVITNPLKDGIRERGDITTEDIRAGYPALVAFTDGNFCAARTTTFTWTEGVWKRSGFSATEASRAKTVSSVLSTTNACWVMSLQLLWCYDLRSTERRIILAFDGDWRQFRRHFTFLQLLLRLEFLTRQSADNQKNTNH